MVHLPTRAANQVGALLPCGARSANLFAVLTVLRPAEASSLRVRLHRPVPQHPQSWDHQIVSRIIEFVSPETDIK